MTLRDSCCLFYWLLGYYNNRHKCVLKIKWRKYILFWGSTRVTLFITNLSLIAIRYLLMHLWMLRFVMRCMTCHRWCGGGEVSASRNSEWAESWVSTPPSAAPPASDRRPLSTPLRYLNPITVEANVTYEFNVYKVRIHYEERETTSHVVLSTDSEVMGDSVSKLTSGGVVCGNLALALRGKHRQHKPAWTVSQEVSSLHRPSNVTFFAFLVCSRPLYTYII